MQPSSSTFKELNNTDWFKGLRGALITYVAGLGTQILIDLQAALEQCEQGICAVDFGAYDFLLPLAISAVGFAIEMVRRWLTDFTK